MCGKMTSAVLKNIPAFLTRTNAKGLSSVKNSSSALQISEYSSVFKPGLFGEKVVTLGSWSSVEKEEGPVGVLSSDQAETVLGQSNPDQSVDPAALNKLELLPRNRWETNTHNLIQTSILSQPTQPIISSLSISKLEVTGTNISISHQIQSTV